MLISSLIPAEIEVMSMSVVSISISVSNDNREFLDEDCARDYL